MPPWLGMALPVFLILLCLPTVHAAEDVLLVEEGRVTVNGDFVVAGEGTIGGFGTIPVGGIIMWSGDQRTLPEGWALCDGETVNGMVTPNLKGQFVVGYDPSDVDYRKVGKPQNNAGVRTTEHTHTVHAHSHGKGDLHIDWSGSHNHELKGDGEGGGDYRPDKRKSERIHRSYWTEHSSHRHESSDFRGRVGNVRGIDGDIDQSTTRTTLDNRPPYYVLAFIMRIR